MEIRPSKAACVLCNSTDQVEVRKLSPKQERLARSEIGLREDQELMPPGLCVRCLALPKEELRARLEMNFRNSCADLLIASGVPLDVAREFVATGPTEHLWAFVWKPATQE
jgi:hypothetical protein